MESNAVPPIVQHEVKPPKPSGKNIVNFKDVSDGFIDMLAREWYEAHRVDILMNWAQGPGMHLETSVRSYLGTLQLRSEWRDPRLGVAMMKLIREDISK